MRGPPFHRLTTTVVLCAIPLCDPTADNPRDGRPLGQHDLGRVEYGALIARNPISKILIVGPNTPVIPMQDELQASLTSTPNLFPDSKWR
jgi:hypothetical protein